MRKFVATAVFLLLTLTGWSQSPNATISGAITDADGTPIRNAAVVATNTQTGVAATTSSNPSGVYNFPNLQPGVYTLKVSVQGFAEQTRIDIPLASTQHRMDFKLAVAAEASSPTDALATSASVDDVLSQSMIERLPIVGNDLLSLTGTLPGVVTDEDFFFGGRMLGFNGLSQVTLRTTRDGMDVGDARYNIGVSATTVLHPEWVQEMRYVLSPADAEAGRGNGQIRIVTRSGTNRYAGTASWNIRHSALNANTWTNNSTNTRPNWYNNQDYTVTYGGPIVKNKTFFYALWNQQLNDQRVLVGTNGANAMTDPARNGIFRYFERWFPGHALTVTNTTGMNPTTASVDSFGNPKTPLTNPDGTPYTAGLRCFSVFGNIKFDGSPFTAADCPGGTALINPTAWDSRRPISDPTGYIRKILDKMPRPNYFGVGDGLNRASYRWMQHREGDQGIETFSGRDLATDRKQLNIKLDEHFSAKHNLSVGWTYERNDTQSEVPTWPDGISYPTKRYPQVFTANFTSALSPVLLNEGRFGIRIQDAQMTPPWESDEFRARALDYMIPASNGYVALISPGAAAFSFGGSLNGVMNTAPLGYVANRARTYSFADTLSATIGKHAFRAGAGVHVTNGLGFNLIIPAFLPTNPRVAGGPGGNASPIGAGPITGLPNLVPMSRTQAASMLYFLAGSVTSASMPYWIDGPDDVTNGTWENVQTSSQRYTRYRRREWNAFLKDDWKVSRDLTLNLGLRFEYYGSPFMGSGLTTTMEDYGDGLWGTFRTSGGNPFDRWLRPGSLYLSGYGPTASPALACVAPNCDVNTLTRTEFVGPNSPNPSRGVIPVDGNNFGPAIGFAWRLPWFGDDKTTVRGGYQVTYGGNFGATGNSAGGPFISTVNEIDSAPGGISQANATVVTGGPYLDLRSIPSLIPALPTNPATPGRVLDVFASTNPLDFYAFDSNYATPYVQNFNLSVSRTVTPSVSLDFRYIGSMSKKEPGIIDLNTPNVYHNTELFNALELTRAGGNAALFDQMFAGLNLNSGVSGYGPVGTDVSGIPQTGSSHLRRNGVFGPLLANGNYPELARLLNGNGAATGFLNLPQGVTGVGGRLLRNACDRIAAGQTTIGPANPGALVCFPEDYLRANPQLAGAFLITNSGSSNYHSLQSQMNVRHRSGLAYVGTYTWSKSLGVPGLATVTYGAVAPSYTDPSDPGSDYTFTGLHRKHAFRSHASFDLPLGPGRFLFGNSSGWAARLTEGWQTSVILTLTSGARMNIEAGYSDSGFATGLYGSSVPDVVRRWPSFQTGTVQWDSVFGGYFGIPAPYYTDLDPQCAAVTTADNLRSLCGLTAVFDAFYGEPVLQNPKPGTRGTFGQRRVELPGTWNLDANLAKTITLGETSLIKSLQLRVDERMC